MKLSLTINQPSLGPARGVAKIAITTLIALNISSIFLWAPVSFVVSSLMLFFNDNDTPIRIIGYQILILMTPLFMFGVSLVFCIISWSRFATERLLLSMALTAASISLILLNSEARGALSIVWGVVAGGLVPKV